MHLLEQTADLWDHPQLTQLTSFPLACFWRAAQSGLGSRSGGLIALAYSHGEEERERGVEKRPRLTRSQRSDGGGGVRGVGGVDKFIPFSSQLPPWPSSTC